MRVPFSGFLSILILMLGIFRAYLSFGTHFSCRRYMCLCWHYTSFSCIWFVPFMVLCYTSLPYIQVTSFRNFLELRCYTSFFLYFGCTISWFLETCGVIQVFLYLAVHHCLFMVLYKLILYFGNTILWFFDKCCVIQVYLYLAVYHCL